MLVCWTLLCTIGPPSVACTLWRTTVEEDPHSVGAWDIIVKGKIQQFYSMVWPWWCNEDWREKAEKGGLLRDDTGPFTSHCLSHIIFWWRLYLFRFWLLHFLLVPFFPFFLFFWFAFLLFLCHMCWENNSSGYNKRLCHRKKTRRRKKKWNKRFGRMKKENVEMGECFGRTGCSGAADYEKHQQT